jgi:Flp pilus assembly protein TadB
MDPLVMLILVPLAILLVFAVALGWRHPRQGTEIVGRSVSEESDASARLKRRDRRSRRRRLRAGRKRVGGSR